MIASDEPLVLRSRGRIADARFLSVLYLWIGLPLAVAMCFVMKPFGVPDENYHFTKTVSVSQGTVIPEVADSPVDGRDRPTAGDRLDTGVGALDDAAAARPVDRGYAPADIARLRTMRASGRRMFHAFSNTAIYFPLYYLPAAAATWLSRAIDLPVLSWLYVGRLANALIWCACAFVAIRRARDKAPLFFVLAMLPIVLQQAGSVSADSMLFASTLLFAALLGRFARDREPSRRELALLGLLTIVFGAGKIGYILFAALPPIVAFCYRRRITPAVAFLAGCTLVAGLVWLGWAWTIRDSVFAYKPGEIIDPHRQLALAIGRPVHAAALVVKDMSIDLPRTLLEMAGWKLGWLSIKLPLVVVVGTLAAIAAATVAGEPGPVRSSRDRAPLYAAVALSIASTLVVYLLLFLQFNGVDAQRIVGFQGRYYVPMLMICGSLIPAMPVRAVLARRLGIAAIGWMTMAGIVTLVAVYRASWI